MPTHLVNLDALFKREDFEATTDPIQQPSQLGMTLKVNELESTSLTYIVSDRATPPLTSADYRG